MKPWKHSTGARSEEGKEISKMNALKHGCYTASARAALEQVQELLNRTAGEVQGCLSDKVSRQETTMSLKQHTHWSVMRIKC